MLCIFFCLLDGSSKLMDASVESKRKEERDLLKQDTLAHRRLRDATAAAAVECKQHIEDCDNNLKFLKDQVCQTFDKKIIFGNCLCQDTFQLPILFYTCLVQHTVA